MSRMSERHKASSEHVLLLLRQSAQPGVEERRNAALVWRELRQGEEGSSGVHSSVQSVRDHVLLKSNAGLHEFEIILILCSIE